MKKSIMLLIAASLVAFLTGCGGGGGSSASVSKTTNDETVTDNTNDENTLTNENVFDGDAEDSATNATYTTTATGDFPPAPPIASLEDAQEEANKLLN